MTWIKRPERCLVLRDRKVDFEGAVSFAKDFFFLKFEAWLEVECNNESEEEDDLNNHVERGGVGKVSLELMSVTS
jgi:hypothetical protein